MIHKEEDEFIFLGIAALAIGVAYVYGG